MKDATNILNYTIHWISRSDSAFIGELFFVVRNSSGGTISTPIGYLVGFIDPGADYYGSHWKIRMIVSDAIRYDVQTNSTRVFIKSAYANKLRYYAHKLKEFNRDIIRIDPGLPAAIRETLTQSGTCSYPLEMQIITGKDECIFSNVEYDFD
jgi:hypothetical protein